MQEEQLMNSRVWLQITSGHGPEECAYAVKQILTRFMEDAREKKLTVELLSSTCGRYSGTLESVLIAVEGAGSTDFCRYWTGTILWISRSPFRPDHKRKNWFIGVELLHPPAQVRWRIMDLKFESMRASGPGGQYVNKTESAVRVTHIPSGLSATSREERSQHANRKLALARLAALFSQKEQADVKRFKNERWDQHNCLERGHAVRVFVGPNFEPK
jgi:peptide chain release factor